MRKKLPLTPGGWCGRAKVTFLIFPFLVRQLRSESLILFGEAVNLALLLKTLRAGVDAVVMTLCKLVHVTLLRTWLNTLFGSRLSILTPSN